MTRPLTWNEQAMIDRIKCKPGWTWLQLPLGKSRCVRAGGGYARPDPKIPKPSPEPPVEISPPAPPTAPPPADMENIAATGQIDQLLADEVAKRTMAAPVKKQRQRMARI